MREREETTVVMHDRMYTYDSGRPSAFMPSRKDASVMAVVASSLSLHAASAHNNTNRHNAHHR